MWRLFVAAHSLRTTSASTGLFLTYDCPGLLQYASPLRASADVQDGFAEESTIFGGYNQFPASEQGSGVLRLLDNFTLYIQTDDEGSEELVDLQEFTAGKQL